MTRITKRNTSRIQGHLEKRIPYTLTLIQAILCLVVGTSFIGSTDERAETAPLYNVPSALPSAPLDVYDALQGRIDREAIESAVEGYNNLQRMDVIDKPILVVIDFTKSANEKRLFIVDMRDTSMVHHSLVAHGKNTGELFATDFSNTHSSYKSSLGFFRTAETYSGKHGLSLRIDGIEPGINDNARERAIVIHSADYVSESFIAKHGRLGRSLGCPALPVENYAAVIHSIKEGCLLFAHGGKADYIEESSLLAGN
jgi:hypothetical protein